MEAKDAMRKIGEIVPFEIPKTIVDFPDELTLLFFSYVPAQIIFGVLTLTCKSWKRIIGNNFESLIKERFLSGEVQKFDVQLPRQFNIFNILCSEATQGSKPAQQLLMEMLDASCTLKYADYFAGAAGQNDPWGLYCLGRILAGYGIRNVGLTYLKSASDQGLIEAKFLYGKILNDREDWEEGDAPTEGLKLLEEAAKENHPQAMYELSRFCPSKNKRKKLLRQTAASGFIQSNLALYLNSNETLEVRLNCLLKAVLQKNGTYYSKEAACFELGVLIAKLEQGFLDKSYSKELMGELTKFKDEKYRNEKGILEEHFNLGSVCIFMNENRGKSVDQAYKNPNSIPFFLGVLYETGIKKDQEMAKSFLLQGIRQADHQNIWRQSEGKKVPRRDPGFQFLNQLPFARLLSGLVKKKASEGIIEYQYVLGLLSFYKVTGTNYEDSLESFMKAADQGHSDSSYFAYWVSLIEKNEESMVKYFRKFTAGRPFLAKILIDEIKEDDPLKEVLKRII